MLFLAMLLLQAEPAAPPAGGGGGPLSMLPMLAMLGVLGYLIVFRPMQKEKRDQQAMLAALKKNDEVVTSGGLIGIVVSIKEKGDEVVLKVDSNSNTRVRILKSSILRVIKEPEAEKEPAKEGGA